MTLTDEELSKAIVGLQTALHGLREEVQARALQRAEALLPEFSAQVAKYFGPDVRVKVEADTHDYDVLLLMEVPSIGFETFSEIETRFMEDPENDKFYGNSIIPFPRFVKE